MKYQLRVASSAQSDLETILEWIAQRSIDGALKWVNAYERMLERLVDHLLLTASPPRTTTSKTKSFAMHFLAQLMAESFGRCIMFRKMW